MRKLKFVNVAILVLFLVLLATGITKGFDWLNITALVLCGVSLVLEIKEGWSK